MIANIEIPDGAQPIALFYWSRGEDGIQSINMVAERPPSHEDWSAMGAVAISRLSEISTPENYRSTLRMILENKMDFGL